MTTFQQDLEDLINKHSMENGSDTPDWILADYIMGCLLAFNNAVNKRERFYGREKTLTDQLKAPKGEA